MPRRWSCRRSPSARRARRARPAPIPSRRRRRPARRRRRRRTTRVASSATAAATGRASHQCRRCPGSSNNQARWTPSSSEELEPRPSGDRCMRAAWSCSPVPASRPTRASPTSVARTACGPRTRRPRRPSNIQHYLADPEVRRAAWRTRVDGRLWSAPSRTPATGRSSSCSARASCIAVVTQNIDELHQRAGTDPDQGDRGPRHGALDTVLGVRRPAADGGGARPGARRRGRPAVPGVRRDRQVATRSASGRRSCPR